MTRLRPHTILPRLLMSVAAILPGASAALIMLHAGGSSSATEIAGVSSGPVAPVADSASSTSKVTRKRQQAAGAKPTTLPATVPTRAATKKARVRVVPTATAVPSTSSGQSSASLQSSTLQSQSSSTNYVSGATSQ